MNLFDQLVSEALKNQPQLIAMRNVVEKSFYTTTSCAR